MITSNPLSFAYFPGCSLTSTNRAYDMSTRGVARALGMDLVELDDWNCCGATAYMAINEKRSFVLSARNLAIAEAQGRDLVTVCNGCYVVLRKTNKYMAEDPQVQDDVRRALAAGGIEYGGQVRVRHFLDVLVNDVGEEAIRQAVTRPMAGLKVAAYYGCQIGRPFGEIDDAEQPELMDRLFQWLGAEPTPFALKAKCCGGMMMTTQPEIGQQLTAKVLHNAKTGGADCVATACPLCQMNLAGYQAKVGKTSGFDCHLPVLYFTQLVGYALGVEADKLGLKDSFTPVEALLAEKVQSS